MDGNGLALCLMAGWGVRISGFAVRYLYFYVEEKNIHSYVNLKMIVLPPMHMAYFQKVCVILHDDLQRESALHNKEFVQIQLCSYAGAALYVS
jgi:hypothetical protein